MKQVAVINGKPVYSDKQVAYIQDDQIIFADGSSCNVRTGEVVNNGRGSISIGGSGGDTEKTITHGPERFVAHSLDLRNLNANVQVDVHSTNAVEVTIEGVKSDVEAIRSYMDQDTLVIEGQEETRSSGTVINFGGGRTVIGGRTSRSVITSGNMFIGGGRIVTDGDITVITGSGGSNTKVNVKVPKGIAISVNGVEGSTRIGDTEGSLRCRISGSGDISVGKVGNTNFRISGSGDVYLKEVNGDLSFSISGSGDLQVQGGRIGQLELDISGSGDVNINATAENASLDVSGSGDVYVRNVKNRPRKHKSGSGSIRVGNW